MRFINKDINNGMYERCGGVKESARVERRYEQGREITSVAPVYTGSTYPYQHEGVGPSGCFPVYLLAGQDSHARISDLPLLIARGLLLTQYTVVHSSSLKKRPSVCSMCEEEFKKEGEQRRTIARKIPKDTRLLRRVFIAAPDVDAITTTPGALPYNKHKCWWLLFRQVMSDKKVCWCTRVCFIARALCATLHYRPSRIT